MSRHLFPADLIWAALAGSPPPVVMAPGAAFTAWTDLTGGSDVTADLKTPDGITTLDPHADSQGIRPSFRGPDTTGGLEVQALFVDTGVGQRFPVYSVDGLVALLTYGVLTNVVQTWTAGQNFDGPVDFAANPTVNGAPLIGGGGGGGGSGTVASTGITDSSAVGRAVLTAADAAAARAAIGAGTGNGTSNLALGTTAGTALAGNTNIGTLFAQVTNLVAFLNATGLPYTVYVDPVTGLWPNSGARVHASGAAMTGFTSRWIWDSQAYAGALKPAGMIDNDFWDQRVA